MSTSTPSPSTSTSTFRLYYPPGMLGRAEPIRLILLELGLQWEEPWASSPSLHSIDGCLAELERMRREMPQPVFGMPILEHRMGGGGGGGGGGVGERKEEGKAGEGEVFWLGQTPVIAHYLATVEGTGRLLPKGGVREGHRACQLAADIEDATAEAYHAWRLLSKAKGYVSEQAVKEVEGTQRWWTEKRLPAWAAHFEKALTTGGRFCMGDQPTYVDSLLFSWLDGIESSLPDAYKQMHTPRLHAFKQRASTDCPVIAKRLQSRQEKYMGMAPGF